MHNGGSFGDCLVDSFNEDQIASRDAFDFDFVPSLQEVEFGGWFDEQVLLIA